MLVGGGVVPPGVKGSWPKANGVVERGGAVCGLVQKMQEWCPPRPKMSGLIEREGSLPRTGEGSWEGGVGKRTGLGGRGVGGTKVLLRCPVEGPASAGERPAFAVDGPASDPKGRRISLQYLMTSGSLSIDSVKLSLPEKSKMPPKSPTRARARVSREGMFALGVLEDGSGPGRPCRGEVGTRLQKSLFSMKSRLSGSMGVWERSSPGGPNGDQAALREGSGEVNGSRGTPSVLVSELGGLALRLCDGSPLMSLTSGVMRG